jgi:hypothetical protein
LALGAVALISSLLTLSHASLKAISNLATLLDGAVNKTAKQLAFARNRAEGI